MDMAENFDRTRGKQISCNKANVGLQYFACTLKKWYIHFLTPVSCKALFQTNKGSSQIRAAIPYLTDQIRAKVSLTLICSGLPLFD